jgi:hypothetical protein
MDKGIRPYCNAKFVELLNVRNRGELTNTQFRKNVMADVMDQFGCTLASAATHYNHAFKTVKELNAELVSGLGRPEDKKGGRKPKAKLVVAPVLLLGYTPPAAGAVEFIDQQYAECVAAAAGAIGPVDNVDQAPNGSDEQVDAAPEVKTYTVTRVKDGAVIATGLVLTDAEALCAKAVAAKKAKLAFA